MQGWFLTSSGTVSQTVPKETGLETAWNYTRLAPERLRELRSELDARRIKGAWNFDFRQKAARAAGRELFCASVADAIVLHSSASGSSASFSSAARADAVLGLGQNLVKRLALEEA